MYIRASIYVEGVWGDKSKLEGLYFQKQCYKEEFHSVEDKYKTVQVQKVVKNNPWKTRMKQRFEEWFSYE